MRGNFKFNTNHFPIQDFYLVKVAKRSDSKYQTKIVQKVLAGSIFRMDCYEAGDGTTALAFCNRFDFDVIFLDADKAHYPEFLDWSVRVLRPGGLLLADNVLRSSSWHGQTLLDPTADDPRILAIREFNRRLAADPRFTAIIIPMRAGIAAAVFQP